MNKDQFIISEDSYNKFRKKWLLYMIPGYVIVIAFVIGINLRTDKGDVGLGWIETVLPFAVTGILFFIVILRSLSKQKQFFLGYSVTIAEDRITRIQPNTSPLSISFMEIKEIVKHKNGAFTIRGLDRNDIINIPYLVDDATLLESRLAELAPISSKSQQPFIRKFAPLGLVLGGFGLFLYVAGGTNNRLVVPAGIVLLGLLGYGFYELNRNKNLPVSVRRFRWYLLFFMLIVLSKIVSPFIV
jgi:hypothetical protein